MRQRGTPMPYVHLCRYDGCWCDGMTWQEIVSYAINCPSVDEWWKENGLEDHEMAFKRPDSSSKPKPSPKEWNDPGDKQDYPNLYSFLHDNMYDDGKPRVTGSMSIFTKMGCLRASLNDKDLNRVCYIEALTIAELWELAERAIGDDSTEWIASSRTTPF